MKKPQPEIDRRRIKFKAFSRPEILCQFCTMNGIKQGDIESITIHSTDRIYLYYWTEI